MAATKATSRCDLCILPLLKGSALHQVPTGHPGVHVGSDVAVVQPPPWIVLYEACRDRLIRPHRGAILERAAAAAPAMPVDVEGVEVLVHADHVQGDALASPRTDR